MSSHRAMKELAENPEAVRALARYLIACGQRAGDAPVSWTDWEVDFLDSMAQRESAEPLSLRQREILTELKSAAQRSTSVDGFSVRGLVERCWLERFDLGDEDDQRFVEDLKAAGVQAVTGRQRGRLLACCRELGIIERHQGF
jgi:hypothetical protein